MEQPPIRTEREEKEIDLLTLLSTRYHGNSKQIRLTEELEEIEIHLARLGERKQEIVERLASYDGIEEKIEALISELAADKYS